MSDPHEPHPDRPPVPPRAAELDPPDDDSDLWLVERARRGDAQALEVLLRRHRDRVYRIAMQMLGNAGDAEDVAQEVAIQVWTALAGFTGASAFTTWLYRITINSSLNHRRRRRHRTEPLTPATGVRVPPAARVGSAEDSVVAAQRLQASLDALAALPPDLRSALVLHQMEGLSYAQVAAVLNTSESTVRGRIARARRAMIDRMRGWA